MNPYPAGGDVDKRFKAIENEVGKLIEAVKTLTERVGALENGKSK